MRRSHQRLIWLTVSLSLAVVAAAPPASPAVAVRLVPDHMPTQVGDFFTLSVLVENVSGLNEVELWLIYDPTALEVQDAVPVTVGTQIAPGPFLQPNQTKANWVENGRIRYNVEQLPPDEPVSGSGVVATITFKVLKCGETQVRFDRTASHLYDRNRIELPVAEWTDALVACPARFTLTGVIKRQGWDKHDGTVVWVWFRGAVCRTYTDPSGGFRIDIPCDIIVVDDFSGLNVLPEQPEEFRPPRCLRPAFVRAYFPNYLRAQGWVCLKDVVTDIGQITLPGGDVNGDGCINMLDTVKIISHLGKTVPPPCAVVVPGRVSIWPPAPPCDINGDCTVNIQDLVLAAGNFGKCDPIRIGPVFTEPTGP